MANEPNISGSPGGEQGSTPISSSFKFNVPGLGQTTGEIRALNSAIGDLKSTLKEIGTQQATLTQGLNGVFESISSGAANTARALNSGAGSGGGGGGGGFTHTGIPYSFGDGRGGGTDALTSTMDSIVADSSIAGMLTRLLSGGMTFAYNRFEESRANAPMIASALGPISTYTNKPITELIHSLQEGTPVKGDLGNVLQALAVGGSAGYGDLSSGRSGAFFEGVRQMQAFTPGVGAGQLAGMQKDWLSNTGGHQRALMLTGGAMSGFGAGGIPKTLQEWAESTLKWFEGQRPGSQRGRAFTREELITQQFPGSNMDAWFNVNGVPGYMREYFWQYVIGKANAGGSSDFDDILSGERGVGQRGQDIAWERLRTQTAQSRREFQMLGSASNYEQFTNREGMDRRFEEAMGQVDKYMGQLLGGFAGGVMSAIPTPIANILATNFMTAVPNAVSSAASFFTGGGGFGDPQARRGGRRGGARVGDPRRGGRRANIGDTYGPYGGTGFAGMDPSFADRISAMMADNPNISITSGFRDGALQGRLHAAGVGMVAPAGHSDHSRGLAADLGPESEFDWIVANAGRYGLESGINFDEPWHVGMPGTVSALGIGDPDRGDSEEDQGGPSLLDRLGGWGGLAGGFLGSVIGTPLGLGIQAQSLGRSAGMGAQAVVDGVGGIEGIYNLLGSLVKASKGVFNFFGSAIQGISGIMSGDFSAMFGEGGLFDPSGLMDKAMGGIEKLTGLPLTSLMKGGDSSIDAITGWLGESAGQGGRMKPVVTSSVSWEEATTVGGVYGMPSVAAGGGAGVPADVARILQKYGAGVTKGGDKKVNEQGVLQALQAAAAAGFSGDELITMVAIAGRESGWDPSAHRSSVDKSQMSGDRGLFQINYSHDPNLAARGIISSNTIAGKRELFNPNVNAKAAKYIFDSRGSFADWGFDPRTGKWSAKGAPLYAATNYVQPVYNIAKQHGFVGDPRRRSAVGDVATAAQYAPQMAQASTISANFSPHTTTTVASSPISIVNHWTLDVRGNEADARRVAAVVAGHLKDQLQESEYLGV